MSTNPRRHGIYIFAEIKRLDQELPTPSRSVEVTMFVGYTMFFSHSTFLLGVAPVSGCLPYCLLLWREERLISVTPLIPRRPWSRTLFTRVIYKCSLFTTVGHDIYEENIPDRVTLPRFRLTSQPSRFRLFVEDIHTVLYQHTT